MHVCMLCTDAWHESGPCDVHGVPQMEEDPMQRGLFSGQKGTEREHKKICLENINPKLMI